MIIADRKKKRKEGFCVLTPWIFDGVHRDFAWLECVPTPPAGFGKNACNCAISALTNTLHVALYRRRNVQRPKTKAFVVANAIAMANQIEVSMPKTWNLNVCYTNYIIKPLPNLQKQGYHARTTHCGDNNATKCISYAKFSLPLTNVHHKQCTTLTSLAPSSF